MRLVLGSLFALALPACAAFAQDAPVSEIVLQPFDVTTTILPPPWLAESAASGSLDAETSLQQGTAPNGVDVFIMEWIPAGEEFSNWSELYAVMAESPRKAEAVRYRNGIAQRYFDACTDAKVQPVTDQGRHQIFVLYCPNYKSDPARGEIAVMYYQRFGDHLIKHYYHRRGAPFSVDASDTWPMDPDEVQRLIDHVGALRVARTNP